jgi:hypothetical protein
VGEFGWELMAYQARLRALASAFNRVVVLGDASKAGLYEDFAEYRSVGVPSEGTPNTHGRVFADAVSAGRFWGALEEVVRRASEDLVSFEGQAIERHRPWLGPRSWVPTFFPWQAFWRYGRSGARREPRRVVLVSRSRIAARERNLPEAWWDELAERLTSRGFCIEHYAEDVTEGIEQFAGAGLAIGGSTGGLHLASLCGCPHLVWGPGSEQRWDAGPGPVSNHYRYHVSWNPLGTPVAYLPWGWRPPVKAVERATVRMVEGLFGNRAPADGARRWRRRVWAPQRMRLRALQAMMGRTKGRARGERRMLWEAIRPRHALATGYRTGAQMDEAADLQIEQKGIVRQTR